MAVWEDLSEEEAYLFAILDDQSGIDQAEFLWFEPPNDDGCWRFWPFQFPWLRCTEKLQIDLCCRSIGKSLSIVARMFAFAMRAMGQEALITAPELIHLEPIANLIEERLQSVRLTRELLPKGRSAITHRPFMVNTKVGSRILGRIPQRDGKGVKGCVAEGTLVLTEQGYRPVETLQVGDLVMTHRSRWRRVEEIQEDVNDCYEVHGAGAFPTTVSCDHRFYGAEDYDGTGELTEPGWHDVELMLEHRVHWATPLLFGSLPIPPLPEGFEDLQWSEKFWYGVGEHLAGGATSTDVDSWVAEHFGPPPRPIIPGWLLGATRHFRENVLAGFVGTSADGLPDELSATAPDRALALGIQMLAQSLGYRTIGAVAGAESSVCVRRSDDDGLVAFTPIATLQPVGKVRIFNPIVEEDHSYITESVVSHNVHPLQLEQDESQDFPERGFKELNETLKTAVEGSEWRAHGVTKGVRGEFYRRTQPNSGWKVHKIQAMHRPTWTPEERELSLQKYGGHRDDPDFRRNVYGEHGDQTAALFVMSRLAKCIDDNKDSPYNTLEYQHVEISDAMIAEAREQGRDVADLLVLPESHRDYTKSGAKTWGGMDVGLTVDPSEILVFAEYEMSAEERKESQKVDRNTQNSKKACPKAGATRLKLLLRLSLKRVTNPDQIKFILAVIDFYQLERFSLDRTGIGFPLWQDLQNLFREAEDMVGQVSDPQDKEKFRARAAVLREAAKRIKGYNFSEKVIVDIDDTVVVDEVDGDPIEDAAMRRTVLEHSTDLIRRMVDEERLWLPWDVTLIAEYEGQTISFSNSPIDQYGKRRRVFAEGKFHAFDASRMFAMGIGQQKIEALVEKPKEQESVFVQFG